LTVNALCRRGTRPRKLRSDRQPVRLRTKKRVDHEFMVRAVLERSISLVAPSPDSIGHPSVYNYHDKLFRYKLRQDTDLFERAYGYIREYY
jgi:hypothetical protein